MCEVALSYIWKKILLQNITKNTWKFSKIQSFEIENSKMYGLFEDVNGFIGVIAFFNNSILISGLQGQSRLMFKFVAWEVDIPLAWHRIRALG